MNKKLRAVEYFYESEEDKNNSLCSQHKVMQFKWSGLFIVCGVLITIPRVSFEFNNMLVVDGQIKNTEYTWIYNAWNTFRLK